MLKEIEAKFCPIDKDICRQKLKQAGFALKQPEFLMTRVTLHSKILNDRWGRVRQEANRVTMTIKRVLDGNSIHGTEESEVIVPSVAQGLAFLEACSFTQTSYQENYREMWVLDNIEATIDTWPGLPPLIEIEGKDAETVYGACEKLGFKKEDALYGSIDLLYEKILGIPAQTMVKTPRITFEQPLVAA